jgi:hypothetical protein
MHTLRISLIAFALLGVGTVIWITQKETVFDGGVCSTFRLIEEDVTPLQAPDICENKADGAHLAVITDSNMSSIQEHLVDGAVVLVGNRFEEDDYVVSHQLLCDTSETMNGQMLAYNVRKECFEVADNNAVYGATMCEVVDPQCGISNSASSNNCLQLDDNQYARLETVPNYYNGQCLIQHAYKNIRGCTLFDDSGDIVHEFEGGFNNPDPVGVSSGCGGFIFVPHDRTRYYMQCSHQESDEVSEEYYEDTMYDETPKISTRTFLQSREFNSRSNTVSCVD